MAPIMTRYAARAKASPEYSRDAYLARESESLNESSKQPQRMDVLEFMRQHWPSPRRTPRVLSMPSLNWSFERQLSGAMGDVYHVCVERHWEAIMRALEEMPGNYWRHRQQILRNRTIDYVATHRAKITAMTCEDYLMPFRGSTPPRKDADRYRKLFWNLDAAWLDFQGPLSETNFRTIQALPMRMDAKQGTEWPVVVTVLGRREKEPWENIVNGFGGRARFIEAALDSTIYATAKLIEERRYVTGSGSPMVTAFCMVRPCARRRSHRLNLFELIREYASTGLAGGA